MASDQTSAFKPALERALSGFGTADSATPSTLDSDGQTILLHLGGAVAASWDMLPHDVQRQIFAAAGTDAPARQSLARFLHAHHTRTAPAAPGASALKPGPADTPAAGPHAREPLTNMEATPGSGALPSTLPVGGEADGGAG